MLEIDEKTRFRHDYVRARIACRDITKVPRTAESSLGLAVHDFHFEREVEVEGPEKTLKSGIKITEGGYPPPPKKFKAAETNNKESGQTSGKTITLGKGTAEEKRQSNNVTMSAPSKIGGKYGTGRNLYRQLWGMILLVKCIFQTHLRTLILTVKLLVT